MEKLMTLEDVFLLEQKQAADEVRDEFNKKLKKEQALRKEADRKREEEQRLRLTAEAEVERLRKLLENGE